jgi:orotidine-5'-phosphate decarboxylase
MMQKINDMRDRLIVALDVPTIWDAYRIVSTLGDSVTFYKIGYRLAFAGGLDLARQLAAEGKKVFLDLKLHDIGNTVTEGVESLTRLGVTFLTVHAYPQTMRGAVEGKGEAAMKLLAVTALTSYDDGDLRDAGYGLAVRDLVRMRAEQARTAGIDGIVCSAAEAAIVRDVIGRDMVIVTPGIRPADSAVGDQKRTLTPGEAIRAGVDHLVVGRPIIRAADPRGAAAAIMDEIATAS